MLGYDLYFHYEHYTVIYLLSAPTLLQIHGQQRAKQANSLGFSLMDKFFAYQRSLLWYKTQSLDYSATSQLAPMRHYRLNALHFGLIRRQCLIWQANFAKNQLSSFYTPLLAMMAKKKILPLL